jgi:hypothetical protein
MHKADCIFRSTLGGRNTADEKCLLTSMKIFADAQGKLDLYPPNTAVKAIIARC